MMPGMLQDQNGGVMVHGSVSGQSAVAGVPIPDSRTENEADDGSERAAKRVRYGMFHVQVSFQALSSEHYSSMLVLVYNVACTSISMCFSNLHSMRMASR